MLNMSTAVEKISPAIFRYLLVFVSLIFVSLIFASEVSEKKSPLARLPNVCHNVIERKD